MNRTSSAEPTAPAARVLVLDDEPLVGRAVARVLGRQHEVTVTTSGEEALALLTSGREFDLVLCDLVMPAMSGMDFYRAVGERAPDLQARIVFLTGGAFTLEAQAFLDSTRAERIIKPFDSAALRDLAASCARRRLDA